MKFNIPQKNTMYRLLAEFTFEGIYMGQTRDRVKASRSLAYNPVQCELRVPKHTVIMPIRIADNSIRLEIIECPDKNFNRVKFYTATDRLENLEIEPH